MATTVGRSLANQKFIKTIESQIRYYRQIQTSLIYAERWWEIRAVEGSLPATLAKYKGDNKTPFTSINISPKEYVNNFANSLKITRENSIISFITAFEVYMFDIVKRLIYLFPDIVDQSEMPIEAKDISQALKLGDFKDWFSNRIVDKYLRNKTHLKMLLKIQQIVKFDLVKTHALKLEQWNKWTYVRNAIVHNGQEISLDLRSAWPDRFSNVGGQLDLTDRDVVAIHGLAISLSKIIDAAAMTKFIEKNDALLLVREFFIREGLEDRKEIAIRINNNLACKLRPNEIDQALGFQRRTGARIFGWNFSHYNFEQ